MKRKVLNRESISFQFPPGELSPNSKNVHMGIVHGHVEVFLGSSKFEVFHVVLGYFLN